MKLKENIAKFFSLIFHPLILPTLATFLLFLLPTYMLNYQIWYKKVIIQIVFLATLISPILILLILINLKKVSNIYLSDRKERNYPFIIVSVLYLLTYLFLKKIPLGLLAVPPFISNFILISAGIIFISFIINLKLKLSAHMAGIGGFISYFLVFFYSQSIGDNLFFIYKFNVTKLFLFSFLVIIAGIIASSRLYLKAHNLKEIYIGLSLGIGLGLFSMFL